METNNIYHVICRAQQGTPLIMGILNLDPQSFYPASYVSPDSEPEEIVERLLVEGMDILDLGAMSSRPGSAIISPTTEQARLLPFLKRVRQAFGFLPISVDTLHSSTAQAALDLGVQIINDISAGQFDDQMWPVVSRYGCVYVLMHMRGLPHNMQSPQYTQYDDPVADVIQFLADKIAHLKAIGIHQIIADPGFGFSKTIEQNFEILNGLQYFQILDHPIMVGMSRKSMFWKSLHSSPSEVLPASIAAATIALMKGAKIIRTHDVAATKQAVEVFKLLN